MSATDLWMCEDIQPGAATPNGKQGRHTGDMGIFSCCIVRNKSYDYISQNKMDINILTLTVEVLLDDTVYMHI
jgi:hypothetical protein